MAEMIQNEAHNYFDACTIFLFFSALEILFYMENGRKLGFCALFCAGMQQIEGVPKHHTGGHIGRFLYIL